MNHDDNHPPRISRETISPKTCPKATGWWCCPPGPDSVGQPSGRKGPATAADARRHGGPEGPVHGQYLSQAELAIREALQGGHSRTNLSAQLRVTNGLPASLIYSVTPLYDVRGDISGVLLTFREDVTPSHQSDSGGHINGVALSSLFENLAEGVFTINTAGGSPISTSRPKS
jgi:hypothetical protein